MPSSSTSSLLFALSWDMKGSRYLEDPIFRHPEHPRQPLIPDLEPVEGMVWEAQHFTPKSYTLRRTLSSCMFWPWLPKCLTYSPMPSSSCMSKEIHWQ